MEARIAILPNVPTEAGAPRTNDGPAADQRRARIEQAVLRGGGVIAPVAEATGLIWLTHEGADLLLKTLQEHPAIEWVQFPWAGIEGVTANGVLRSAVTFTSAKELFAPQVSEHALMLILACLRNIVRQARTPHWDVVAPRSLHGKTVTILGGGGIAAELIRLLAPFQCRIRVIRRQAQKMDGADETLQVSSLHSVLGDTDVLVLALALTPETSGIIGAAELALLPDQAIVVNVARGAHLATDALVEALRTNTIAGAGLDVTDPEPLPAGHPLWTDPRVLITSHCADSPEYVTQMLCERVERNVRSLRAGRPLEGLVDPVAGY